MKEYAEEVLRLAENGTAEEQATYAKAAPLVSAMLAYGEYAHNYFSEEEAIKGPDVEIPETYQNYATTGLPEGVAFEGATLSLKSTTTLSLYFRSNSPLTLTCTNPSENQAVITKVSGNDYVIRIRDIVAKDLNKSLTVCVNDEAHTVSYSPLNYCFLALTSGDTKLENTVKALYLYWQAADAYFA